MAKKKKIGKEISALIITILVFIVVTSLHLFGAFQFLENKSYDLRVRMTAPHSRPSDDIIIILLDQDSLDWAQKERGWGWPWPRQAYSEIVEYMNISGAKSIAFDVLFSEPSVYRHARQDEIIDNAVRSLEDADTNTEEQPRAATGRGRREGRSINRIVIEALRSLSAREDDASFINASKNYGNVVQAIMFSSQTGNILSWPANLGVPLFKPENFDDILEKFTISANMRGQFPIQGLRESAGALGSVTGVADPDGIIRRVQLFTVFDGKAIPTLSAASLLVSGYDQHIVYNPESRSLEWEHLSIPVDKNGFTLLRFKGSLDRYIPYRAKDIILSAEAYINEDRAYMSSMNFLQPDNFKDTYVFFGFFAPGLYDIFGSPIEALYPGVGFHVTMLDNLLHDGFIRESTEWLNLLILLAVIVLIVCLTMFSPRIDVSVGGMIIIAAVIVTSAFLAYFNGLWIPMITYLAGTLVPFVTVTLYNYATEGSQKRFIKSAFSQYLSPKVIEQIIQDPSQLKLGGEKREMTAIFTDIRAFSTISEALGDPAKLVELLNFYLTRMSNIVLDNQGTIDKYEGDAIIAFFGAPVHMNNHAVLACRAVVNMKKAEREINREALELKLVTPEVMQAMAKKGIISGIDDPFPLFTRIGMNSGDMVVGNMGTPNKMDYTIMGNAVNLAARLEGVNKQYDTGGILISEYTRANISAQGALDEFIMRSLSRIRVVGINAPLRLYELLDITSEASPELLEMVKSWEQGFAFYEKRDFLAAQNIFQVICGKNSADMVAKKYLNRCIKYLSSPPDDKIWDEGVDNLTEK